MKESVVHMKNMLGKTIWVNPASSKGRPIHGIAFAQGPASTWWVVQKDEEVHLQHRFPKTGTKAYTG